MWAETDVIRLFSRNVVSFSLNVGRSAPIFSANVGPKCGCNQVEAFMLSGRYSYLWAVLIARIYEVFFVGVSDLHRPNAPDRVH